MKKKSLVCDIPSIAYEIAAVNKPNDKNQNYNVDDETLAGLCMHILFTRIRKFFRDHDPDYVVFAFENKNNWRKIYTKSEESKSKKHYKANRVRDNSMDFYFKMLNAFQATCTEHSSIICLSAEGLEGDDVIAGYTQLNASPDHEVIIISGDKDFIQLLKNPNVTLINQRDGKKRNQPGDKLYWDNLDYFIFEKCMRGDLKDHVFSAYPRIRTTRLKKAFEDQYEYTKLMNETWESEINGEPVTHRVGDLYEENKLLLDLTCQPEEIRNYMFEHIKEQSSNFGKFSLFDTQKFLGQFKLKKISEELPGFIDMFVRNYQTANNLRESVPPVTVVNKLTPKKPLTDNGMFSY